jgi:transcriptional regulator with XRE-family HTH domain
LEGGLSVKKETIGDRTAAKMLENGLTQGELARLTDSSAAAVSQWIAGKKVPTRDNVRALAKALNVDPQWLEFGTGPASKPDLALLRQQYRDALSWLFRPEPEDGGRDYGNSNVWALNPSIDTLVREGLQNVIDVALDGKVEMLFRVVRLTGKHLAAFRDAIRWEDLYKHLEGSTKNKQNLGRLIKYGLSRIEETDELLLLLAEDRRTSGLIGEETGGGNFAALCRNNLDSEKQGATAGGSYGIGKAVWWRTSLIGTVLFQSNLSQPTAEGQQYGRFIGRCELPWHPVGEESFAGPGWLGKQDGPRVVSCWNNAALAKDLYLDRPGAEPGTSVLVVGFHDPSSDLPRTPRELAGEIETAVADNFWPAITAGRLDVMVETAEAENVNTQVKVDAAQAVPEFVAALQKHTIDDVTEQLLNPGDVVRRKIALKIPRRKALDGPHEEITHDAVLLVHRGEDGDTAARKNQLAIFRGRQMVVKYVDLKNLVFGGKPFHAVVLCGEAAGKEPSDRAAERFLRTAEPPSHNNFELTPQLKAEYAPGSKKAIDDFIQSAKDLIRELIKPATKGETDGPQAIKELLNVSTTTPSNQKVRIVNSTGRVESDKWHVTGTIRVTKPGEQEYRVSPVMIFLAESGGGKQVQWESLTPGKGCRVEGKRLVIDPKTREATFEGTSDSTSHPIPATESNIMIDIRQIEELKGGQA